MSKDRAAPFSRKHRRYWLPVTGGMLLIGGVNLALGYCTYSPPTAPPERMPLHLPPPPVHLPPLDAGAPPADAPAPGSAAPTPAPAR